MITITSTFTSDPIVKPLQLFLKLINETTEVKITPYRQIFQQLLDPDSLFRQNQDTNIILIRFEDWLSEYKQEPKLFTIDAVTTLKKIVDNFLSTLLLHSKELQGHLVIGLCQPSPMIYNNNTLKETFKELEVVLQQSLSHLIGVYLLTYEEINTYYPVSDYYNEYANKLGHIPYTENYFSALSAMLARKIHAIKHAVNKVIVLDCDDTLWKGVCSEVEDLTNLEITKTQQDFQRFIIQQQQIGKLICLCSKNKESDVWLVFDKHPDMLLKRDHITTYRINTQEKTVNIEEIAQELDLSLDSFLFIDDNSRECKFMNALQPQVVTVQYNENILQILQHLWLLDKLNITVEDKQRTLSYQKKIKQLSSKAYSTLSQFIDNLQLEVQLLLLSADPSKSEQLKRAAELTRKTNQFNCTTRRFTDKQLQQLLFSATILTIHIKDNERDYGLKGVIIFEKNANSLEVSNFLLSCEVLGRGAEYQVLNELAKIAQKYQILVINFSFVSTDRNGPAANFLKSVCKQMPSEDDAVVKFSISTENACIVKYDTAQGFGKYKKNKLEKGLNTEKKPKNKENFIDYLKIANEFSTIQKIQSCLKIEFRPNLPNVSFTAPETPIEKKLVELWEETLGLSRIGCLDNFTQLGGDSIQAALLSAKIYDIYDIELKINELLSSTVVELAVLITSKQKEPDAYPKQIALIRQTEKQFFPLSFAQQRLWFIDQLEPNSSLYNMFVAYEFVGYLNKEALEQAFLVLLKRHESLRTSFITKEGQAYQTVLAYTPKLLQINWDKTGQVSEPYLQELAHQEAKQAFQLDSSPLLRIRILECAVDRHIMLLSMHHIIHDGWSYHIFCKELSKVYSALVEKTPINLPVRYWDYVDFSHWHRQLLDEVRQEKLLSYWLKQLSGFSSTKLPLDYARSEHKQSYEGARVPFLIKKETVAAIKKISQTNQVTLFTTLFSSFSILIGRYTGQEDLLIGTPVSGRHHPNLENMIGFFINILLLRIDLSLDPTFQDFLNLNKEIILQAYQHQDLPFEKLISILNPSRKVGKDQLANIMFIFQNYPVVPLELADLSCKRILSDNESLLLADFESAKVDLSLYLQETGDELHGLFEYNKQLFQRPTIERLITQFQRLLENIIATPVLAISKLSFLDENERNQLLAGLNIYKKDYPVDLSLCELFQQQVERTPHNIALSLSEEVLTYQELNERANQLAHHLIDLGLHRQQIVGIYLDRSFELMISLLAIWKTGATPVCIDPNYPKERVQFIVNDCEAAMLISQGDLYTDLGIKLNKSNQLDRILYSVDLNQEPWKNQSSKKDLEIKTLPDEVFYIIYTSGSTGEPKGVLIEQQGVINMAFNQIDYLGIHSQDRILQFARPTFDAFFWEILGTWLTGAQLCLISKDIKLVGNALIEALNKESISIATLTPSVVEIIPEGVVLPHLRCLVLAGEAVSVATVEKWSRHCQVINAYGPTEATICASIEKIDLSRGKLGIGKPIANVEIYLLDANLEPIPIGSTGEMYIGGMGVAKGYLKREELNRSTFLTVSLNGQNQRLYKTGDRARWLSDGRLEYLGRVNEEQIKLRGFRIELDEIKRKLLKHPAIANAIVKAYDQHLIAYLVAKPTHSFDKNFYLSHAEDQIHQWHTLYEELYQSLDATQPLNFNCLGWNSSYTKKPFLEEEMQEWVDTTVQRILSIKPKCVLEIGCGAGLLMTRIAPHCDFYRATDFSEAAIHYLDKLRLNLDLEEKVDLLQRPAGVFDDKEQSYYDVIIINSVVQYFPDIAHLIQVIEGSIACLQPGGRLFIGDIRSLGHLEAFHRTTFLYNNHQGVSERAITEKIKHEEELLIQADFFEKFAQNHPALECAITQIRRGKHSNELTQFRYDTVLCKKGPQPISKLQVAWLPWDEFATQESIKGLLSNESHAYLAIQGIPNVRLPYFRNKLGEVTYPAVDPEILSCLAEELGYQCIINWSKKDFLHCFDIIFYRGEELVHIIDQDCFPEQLLNLKDWSSYANQPQNLKVQQGILNDIKEKIKAVLPDYMIPANWYFIDEMPLTSHGKIDDKLLRNLRLEKSNYLFTPPTTDTERRLCSLWEICLNIANLGINANFFENGGESFRAVELISRINEEFKLDLPVKVIMDFPTIKELGLVVEQQFKGEEATSYSLINSIVTLKKGSNDELPLFLIHPVGGTVFCYKSLVEQLNFKGPCYAIQDPSIAAKKLLFSSIKEMAACYIESIKYYQPKGPYKLAGHSFGGTVAIEIAQQLLEMKEEVQLVTLFDTWARATNKDKIHHQVKESLIKRYENNKRSEYSAKLFRAGPILDLSFWIKLGADRMNLALNYQVSSNLTFPITLFKAEESADKEMGEQDSLTNYWDQYSTLLKTHTVPGNHESMLEHPYVNHIISLFDNYLTDHTLQQEDIQITIKHGMNY